MIDTNYLKQQLESNQKVYNALTPYIDRQIKDLPDDIKAMIKTLRIRPMITSTGLEKTQAFADSLSTTNLLIEQAIRDPEGFVNLYNNFQKLKDIDFNQIKEELRAKRLEKQKKSSPNSTDEKIKISLDDPVQQTIPQKPITQTPQTINPVPKPINPQTPSPVSPPPSSNIEI